MGGSVPGVRNTAWAAIASDSMEEAAWRRGQVRTDDLSGTAPGVTGDRCGRHPGALRFELRLDDATCDRAWEKGRL